MTEVERIEQIGERRAVGRHVRIILGNVGFGRLSRLRFVSGFRFQLRSMNFSKRNVVAVVVIDVAAGRIRREDQQRDARSVAEEVDRLDEARVPVTAGLVPGDETAVSAFSCGLASSAVRTLSV